VRVVCVGVVVGSGAENGFKMRKGGMEGLGR